MAALGFAAATASAETLNFTVNTSEPVTVAGSPRIAIDVGGVTRYATYASGSGTAALTFGYPVQAGDFDANGIAVVSPLELNAGGLADLAGNAASALTFTLPDTSGVKVQTYSAAFTTNPITNANANAVGVRISNAPAGASFNYTITSSGGSPQVTGSGTISGLNHNVTADVSGLAAGTLTLSVTVSTPAGGTGTASTATATPVFNGVLDGFTNVDVAFSTQRLRQDYTGPLLAVRRSTDSSLSTAPRQIGPTVGGGLNTAELASYCGNTSCFVQIWYDQSGSGRHGQQGASTTWTPVLGTPITGNDSHQPRIYNGTIPDRIANTTLPAVSFNGTNTFLPTSPALPAAATSIWNTYLVDWVSNGVNGRGRVWATTPSQNPGVNAISTGEDYFGISGSGNIGMEHSINPRIVSWSIRPTGQTSSVWINATSSSATASNAVTSSFWNPNGDVRQLTIGDAPNRTRPLHARLHTLIFGNGTITNAQRQAIETWLRGLAL